jgi:hypothetical protein
MNDTNKLLLVGMFLAVFAFAPLGNAQNAGSMYGTQVLTTSGEFRPDLDAGTPLDGDMTIFRADADDDSTFADDVIVLDTDNDGDVSQYDIILTSDGFDDTASGDLVESSNIDLLNLDFVEVDVNCVYADVNDNDFFDEEDYLYLVSDLNDRRGVNTDPAVDTPDGWYEELERVQTIAADDAEDDGVPETTIRLTPNDGGEFGSLVRTTDDDYQDYADNVNDDASDAGQDGAADDVCEFAFYDSENDDEFEGDADRAYLVFEGGVGGGDPVPLYSVVVFDGSSEGGELGELTSSDSADFSPELTEIDEVTSGAIDVVRYDVDTPDDGFDDVFALDLDASGDLSQYDLVIATDGLDGVEVGEVVGLGDSLLLDEGVATGATWTLWADVDENGDYSSGDWIYVCGQGELVPTSGGDAAADPFCVRLTDTDGGDAGTLTRTGDDDVQDWEEFDDLDEFDGTADACFWDDDNDGEFEGGNDLLFMDVADGDCDGEVVDLYDIALFGGTFGAQFGLGDEDYVPTLNEHQDGDAGPDADDEDCGILRHYAGTDEDLADDVFVMDIDCDSEITKDDLVIATGESYGGPDVGDLISLDNELLLDGVANGDADEYSSEVFFTDVNEDLVYNEGDWVWICEGGDSGTILENILRRTDAERNFCIRMTDTDGGDAGSITRTGDDDVNDWTNQAGVTSDEEAFNEEYSFGGAAEGMSPCFFDQDSDGEFHSEDGDLLFFIPADCDDGIRVPQYSLRLWGDFGIIPDQDGNTSTSSSSTSSSSTSSSSTSTSGTVSDDETDEPGNDTPGFELVALVGALAVALILVRRKL